MRRFYLPAAVAVLLIGFWFSPDLQQIAAGVAIFLFGMLMLEDGFRAFDGGRLENLLRQATETLPRSLLFGVAVTTAMQSSSLVSVLAIAFLSTGLITLAGGIGIVFGANLGTTTGAWLVAGLGLKVDIAAYAMPMIALGSVLAFQPRKTPKGFGYALAGLGFLFLGIHFMKEGFEAFRDQVDLTRFAMTGAPGLAVYSLIGVAATVIMQSSHATMVLVITALAAGQLSYDNALALAIGANIGTTITALIGAVSANFQGRRLALAHLVFNTATAVVALAALRPLRLGVDAISSVVGIADTDLALKLAVFHTLFNLLGLVIMVPVIKPLIRVLEQRIPEPAPDISRPRYLTEAVDAFPQTILIALRNEVIHLSDNASELILHGLNLHTHDVYGSTDLPSTIHQSRRRIEFDMDDRYDRRVKSLHGAIVAFTSRIGEQTLPADVTARVYALRDSAASIVRAVKAAKHLRKNVNVYTTRPQGTVTEIYDGLRTEIARILFEIHRLSLEAPEDRSAQWLQVESAKVEEDARNTTRLTESLIRKGVLSPDAATSFLNDSAYAYDAMRDLIRAARTSYLDMTVPNGDGVTAEHTMPSDGENARKLPPQPDADTRRG